MSASPDTTREWLEADGLGGFASGTAAGIRMRRYHALLLAATRPPADRFVLVNGLEVRVHTPSGEHALSSQHYAPGVVHPDGSQRIASFDHEPWPRWRYELEDGTAIEHELLACHGHARVLAGWRVARASGAVELVVRPLLSGRDPHHLHRENPAFRFDAERRPDGALRFRPYDGVPAVIVRSTGFYEHRPDWYHNFLYEEERARGLDHLEDLASPGELRFALGAGDEAFLVLEAEGVDAPAVHDPSDVAALARALREAERTRRAGFASPSSVRRTRTSCAAMRA